jgi:valyl-tRNA synthetase
MSLEHLARISSPCNIYTAIKPSGTESLVEKWILHKLNIAAEEVNTQLTERNLMLATTSAYNFWLYELCDVYIVSDTLPRRLQNVQ